MPTRLPSGLLIYNATPHSLYFWIEKEQRVVEAESDMAISCRIMSVDKEDKGLYQTQKVLFMPTLTGIEQIDEIRSKHPDALIVGSAIAAKAYRGEIVYPIKMRNRIRYGSNKVLNHSTVFNMGE